MQAYAGASDSPVRVSSFDISPCQMLYFTGSSLTRDDASLVCIGEAEGMPNLYRIDLADGETRRLTDNRVGKLLSYVYFDGEPYRGLGKASVSLDTNTGRVFYLQGREIRRVDPDGAEHTLATYPEGQMTGFTHVSSDGRRLCVPTVDARAFEGTTDPRHRRLAIDQRVRAEGLSSHLRVYDTDSGELLSCEPVPSAWVTHVQFRPGDPGTILYNHEWPAEHCGERRVWLWDGKEHYPLRPHTPQQQRDDWVCHEMWTLDGSAVIYHGGYQVGDPFIGRVVPGEAPREATFDNRWQRYGHFVPGPDGVLVCDGYYQTPDDEPGAGRWLSLQNVDWAAGTVRWTPLCRHGSSWDSQDSHPHPIFSHHGDAVYFTSDRDGARAVYRIRLCK